MSRDARVVPDVDGARALVLRRRVAHALHRRDAVDVRHPRGFVARRPRGALLRIGCRRVAREPVAASRWRDCGRCSPRRRSRRRRADRCRLHPRGLVVERRTSRPACARLELRHRLARLGCGRSIARSAVSSSSSTWRVGSSPNGGGTGRRAGRVRGLVHVDLRPADGFGISGGASSRCIGAAAETGGGSVALGHRARLLRARLRETDDDRGLRRHVGADHHGRHAAGGGGAVRRRSRSRSPSARCRADVDLRILVGEATAFVAQHAEDTRALAGRQLIAAAVTGVHAWMPRDRRPRTARSTVPRRSACRASRTPTAARARRTSSCRFCGGRCAPTGRSDRIVLGVGRHAGFVLRSIEKMLVAERSHLRGPDTGMSPIGIGSRRRDRGRHRRRDTGAATEDLRQLRAPHPRDTRARARTKRRTMSSVLPI